LILADGHEVHGASSRGGVIDFSWTIKGNHVLKILAHASPPLTLIPGWRQYDFFVDGQSYFSFPKVFRLGLAAGDPRGDPGHAQHRGIHGERVGGNYDGPGRAYNNYSMPPHRGSSGNLANMEAPRTPAEEDAYLQEAIKNSIQETKAPGAAGPPQISQQGQDLLIDFFSDSAPAPLALPPSTYGMPPATAAYPPAAYPPQNAGPGLLYVFFLFACLWHLAIFSLHFE
jgi:hypothetical protein